MQEPVLYKMKNIPIFLPEYRQYLDNRIHSPNRERKHNPGRVSTPTQTNADAVLPSHPHTFVQSLYSSWLQGVRERVAVG